MENKVRSMRLKKFIIKTVVKIIIFTCLMTIVMAVAQSSVFTNEVALGQMQNSNEAYIFMSIWSKFRPIVNVLCAGVTILFACNIACDTYKFAKTIKNNNEKEKN